MQDRNKTKAQLIAELETLRQRVTELEAAAATHWQTEEALRESRATLDKEQELANLGSFVWNLRDDRLTWSRHMFKIAGLEAGTFAGTLQQASTGIIRPDDQQAIQQQIEQMVAEKRTWPMQFRIVRPDGQERLLQSGSEFILDEHGTPVKCVGIHHDITERIHTEATLRALVTRQEALLAALPDIIMQVDQNKVYTWANQAGLDFFGPDVIGHEAADYFEGEQETYDMVQPLFDGNEDVIYVESWQRRRDGQKRLLAWWCRVLKDEHGNVTGALSSARDITKQRQAEKALQQSEERYQSFVSQIFEGIYRTEFDRPIDVTLPTETQIDRIYENAYMAECNQALAEMYHLPSVNDLVGVRLIDAHGGKDNPVNRATFRRFIENGYKSLNDETFEYTADGQPVWFSSNTLGIVENGYLIRLWGTALVITERKQAEQALRTSQVKLRAILDATPFPIALVDTQDNVIDFWSRSALTLFWHTAPTAAEWYQIAYPDPAYRNEVIERWKPALEKARQSCQAVNTGEYQITCRDGSVRICELYAAFLADNLVVTFNDITERKQAEQAIQVLARFPSENPNPVLRAGLDGRLLYANPASAALLNQWGCQMGEYLPPEWQEHIAAAITDHAR